MFLVQASGELSSEHRQILGWLLEADAVAEPELKGVFIGPRAEIVSPWSTNAVEIVRNVGVVEVERIECFERQPEGHPPVYDRMVQAVYHGLQRDSLAVDREPEPTAHVSDLDAYNKEGGLALSDEEIAYLENVSKELGRNLTDAEVYGFSQINSEHCRHKIFNGEFHINGQKMPDSLFDLIKKTSKVSGDYLVSAYKDNVAFTKGPSLQQFAPEKAEQPSFYATKEISSVLSLKAETHNFPTTVEPFYGASTGSGGEIRDRMAGGIGSIPLAGTAVYMTAYPRLSGSRAQNWEKFFKERNWKYQSPAEILVKASNGASDFGNKFGQPLICGSLLTFEGSVGSRLTAFDRCIMLAGGVGFAREEYALKNKPAPGHRLVLLGGDNYRIGMAGGSVSSVDTGDYSEDLELSAVQRANPEMQKRAYNAIRALCEISENPIVMIHDHGAWWACKLFFRIARRMRRQS